MNLPITSYDNNISIENSYHSETISKLRLKFPKKSERKILRIFLLARLHQLLSELFLSKMRDGKKFFSMEYYAMDSQIIQLLIQSIIETNEYTLEGIAFYTRIPFDIIYDAALGIGNQFSVTFCARIMDLLLKVRPDIAKILNDRLVEIKNKDHTAFSLLLHEAFI